MIRTFALIAALALPAAAQSPTGAGVVPPPLQSPQQIINLSLMEALIAVERTDMAGVFSFVPEVNTPLAFADHLMRSPKALKRFLKKCGKDYKAAGGVSDWDKQVLLYLVGLNPSSAALGVKPISEKSMKQVNELSLVPALPLQIIVEKRGR